MSGLEVLLACFSPWPGGVLAGVPGLGFWPGAALFLFLIFMPCSFPGAFNNYLILLKSLSRLS